jgi:YidC/Oxa1 family membrane protein insertase
MMKMGKLGPEFERLKKKYGDDKEAMAKAQMELLKQHGATPIMGCLPMVLQMPIWIALWQALNTTFDLRHEPFLYGLTWIQDLSKPDHLIDFADFGWEPIHLFLGITISGLNILPLVLAVTYYISIKIQPQPAAITPEQKQQQAIIKWMTVLMFPTLFYSSPSGLCIYILTSTILGIFESKLVRKQFERMEAEQSKFQIVDAEVVTATTAPAKSKPTEKKGFFARIQEQAAQMQKQIEHQKTQRDKQQRKKK